MIGEPSIDISIVPPHVLKIFNLLKLGNEISDKEWDDFIYFRKNTRGKHPEFWHHVAGCRQWFKVLRNTVTHEIFKTSKISEEL